jgi:hypothetical protein
MKLDKIFLMFLSVGVTTFSWGAGKPDSSAGSGKSVDVDTWSNEEYES